MTHETPDDGQPPVQDGARTRWRKNRTTFQRVYDVITRVTEFETANVHPPPDAVGVEQLPLDPHHLTALFSILDWVTDRVSHLHDE